MVNIAANMLGAKTEELSEAEGIFFKIKSILESFNFSLLFCLIFVRCWMIYV